MSNILPLFLQKNENGARERGPASKITYALIPVIPEFVEPLVETDGEEEGTGEDAGDEDACREERELSQIRSGQRHTVSSGDGVIEAIGKLETQVSETPRRWTVLNSRPWLQTKERECRMLPEVASRNLDRDELDVPHPLLALLNTYPFLPHTPPCR